MTTANEYFYKANPEVEKREKRLKDIRKKVRFHQERLSNRIERDFSFSLYDRLFEWLALEGKLSAELKNINDQFERFCRNTLKLY